MFHISSNFWFDRFGELSLRKYSKFEHCRCLEFKSKLFGNSNVDNMEENVLSWHNFGKAKCEKYPGCYLISILKTFLRKEDLWNTFPSLFSPNFCKLFRWIHPVHCAASKLFKIKSIEWHWHLDLHFVTQFIVPYIHLDKHILLFSLA